MLLWTEFADLAQSTGFLVLAMLTLWTLMGLIIYWAISRGAASMKENVKFRVVQDDEPVSQGGRKYVGYPS